MSADREALVREWIDRKQATPHHSRCKTATGGECDCYRRRPEYAVAERFDDNLLSSALTQHLEAELAAARSQIDLANEWLKEASEREQTLREALNEAYTFIEGNYDGDTRELASRIATALAATGRQE